MVEVLKRSRDKASDLGARAIPAATALHRISGLAEQQAHFHRVDKRWPEASPSPPLAERSQLEKLLVIHRRNVGIYEEQAARFGPMSPVHILTSLEDERAAVRDLERRLAIPSTD